MPSKILLAGSQYMLQKMASTFDAGQIHTTSADNGYAALCLLNEIAPDVLIAEISLPGKDGFALCRYVRQEPEFQSLPVVLLDDRFDASNRLRALNVGADVYLSQPFQTDELIDTVCKFLEGKDRADDNAVDGDPRFAVQGAAPRLQAITAKADDSKAPDTAQGAAHSRTTPPYVERDFIPLILQHSRPHWASHPLLRLAGVAAILIGVSLAVLSRMPASGLQTSQRTVARNQPASEDTLAIVESPDGMVPEKEMKINAGREAAPTAGPGDTNKQAMPETDTQAVQADPTVSPDAPKSAKKAEARRHGFKLAASQVTGSNASRALAERGQYTPSVRARTVRSTVLADRLRGGRETAPAESWLGAGAKRFSQGGANAAVWAGKKTGGGVKRLGMALKRIF